jgi:cbb3-type cytochrome oxidase subunit 3
MFKEWFNRAAASTGMPSVGLVIFCGLFLLVVAYVVFALRNKQEVDHMASLPLADDADDASTERGTRE